jgi:hypothetical protein
MKILLKASQATYDKYTDPNFIPRYVDCVYDIMLKQTFEELGHQVAFIGENPAPNIIQDHSGYDMLFFHELPSFIYTREYSLKLLREFKGKKVLYIPTFLSNDYPEIVAEFDYVFVADSTYNVLRWRQEYPNKKILPITWHCPRYEWLDKDLNNPYPDRSFKTVYFGIIIDSYLDILKKLAESGEQIYCGGMYFSDKAVNYRFKQEDLDALPPNLHMVFNGTFNFGEQFQWIRHANLGLAFTNAKHIGCVKHKLVEYMCLGTRALTDETTCNGFTLLDLQAGFVFPWHNVEFIKKFIEYEKQNPYDKSKLQNMARKVFDIKLVCANIVKGLND